jgi:hypothetical protein
MIWEPMSNQPSLSDFVEAEGTNASVDELLGSINRWVVTTMAGTYGLGTIATYMWVSNQGGYRMGP